MDAKAGAREAFEQARENHQPELTAHCIGESAKKALCDGALALGWTAIDLARAPVVRARLPAGASAPSGVTELPIGGARSTCQMPPLQRSRAACRCQCWPGYCDPRQDDLDPWRAALPVLRRTTLSWWWTIRRRRWHRCGAS
jgi:hypothetical protein